jgi:hypothetical protein
MRGGGAHRQTGIMEIAQAYFNFFFQKKERKLKTCWRCVKLRLLFTDTSQQALAVDIRLLILPEDGSVNNSLCRYQSYLNEKYLF